MTIKLGSRYLQSYELKSTHSTFTLSSEPKVHATDLSLIKALLQQKAHGVITAKMEVTWD